MIRKDNQDVTVGMTRMQKAGYYALYGLAYVLSLLPECILYGISHVIYLIFYKVIGYRVKVTRKNLAASFPEKSAKELKDLEHRFYHFLCDYIVETIRLATMSEEEIRRRVVFHGMEHITRHTDQGRSVIFYLAHYASWEWLTSTGLHIPGNVAVGQIYHILENPAFNALMIKLRGRFGHESISMNVTLRTILTYKRKGIPMAIGFLSDQVPVFQATYHHLNFLNHPGTLVITGTERIIKQCDFACVYFDIRRPRRGYYEIDIFPMGQDNNKELPDWQITDEYFRLLEKTIRRQPELWMWSHNRWKRTKEDWDRWKKENGK